MYLFILPWISDNWLSSNFQEWITKKYCLVILRQEADRTKNTNMGAKHSCCAYSSPRTESRNKKEKNRGRESTRDNDRYEPAPINNISQIVSESMGNLPHIR